MRQQGSAAVTAVMNQAPFITEIFGVTSQTDFRDPDSIAKFFDRTGIDQQYVKTIESPSPQNGVNIAMAAKMQADFLAQCERDFKMQFNVTRIRSRCHYAARRLAHGDDNGPIAKGIVYAPLALLKLDPGA